MLIRTIVTFIFLVSTFVSSVAAQKGCDKIIKSKPSFYIAFEKDHEDRINGKLFKKTWLRLTNNTSCEIEVENLDRLEDYRDKKLYKANVRTTAGGWRETTYTQLPVDGLTRDVFYDVQKSPRSIWVAANYDENRDLVFRHTLFPGLSIIFTVDQKYSRKPYRISVPFKYPWEESSFENVEHRTYYWYELPKGFAEDED